ncbi:MFS general substrate transporter [Myriangium duriaei CBS 260.36]|uniref:Cercosporin MFS transporter CTB4 n=1 Tax=Myriangium duriaei CBS 260.36 TaxID=1168546 RepID=A0A9P4J0I9_9PEZI|nr:MFS general substrate transporter [Myriangium duriaei CBS 260.36]
MVESSQSALPRVSQEAPSQSDAGYASQTAKPEDLPNDLEKNNDHSQPMSDATIEDPNLVDFDGPNDRANPKNWSFKRKWLATGLVSLITLMTPMASSMIAPAAQAIKHDLHVGSTFESELIFSIFLLAFVFGPIFLAPLSEMYGRVIVLQIANIWFLIFTLACGFAKTTGQMLAFRFLSGLGACAPQSIGGGVLSDLWSPEQRGMAMALYSLGPMLGPSAGPLMGAWITARTTWRWSFWAVTIFGAAVQILNFFYLQETFAPRLLDLKAQRLRKETGNEKLHTKYQSTTATYRQRVYTSLTRVITLLFTQPIIQFLALAISLFYGIIYLLLATYPLVWTRIYHQSTGIAGLNYISLMIGTTLGPQINGRLLDFTYRRLKARAPDGKGRPEFRIPVLVLSTALVFGGLLMFGWSAQEHTHWIVPNIGIVFFGLGTTVSFTSLQSYTIDAYPTYAASAIGATAIARSVTGFAFPLFADYMFDGIGFGWGCTVLAGATLVVGYGGSFVLWFYGQKLRESSPYAAE